MEACVGEGNRPVLQTCPHLHNERLNTPHVYNHLYKHASSNSKQQTCTYSHHILPTNTHKKPKYCYKQKLKDVAYKSGYLSYDLTLNYRRKQKNC
jgi:hypothetical protein